MQKYRPKNHSTSGHFKSILRNSLIFRDVSAEKALNVFQKRNFENSSILMRCMTIYRKLCPPSWIMQMNANVKTGNRKLKPSCLLNCMENLVLIAKWKVLVILNSCTPESDLTCCDWIPAAESPKMSENKIGKNSSCSQDERYRYFFSLRHNKPSAPLWQGYSQFMDPSQLFCRGGGMEIWCERKIRKIRHKSCNNF